MAAIRRGQSQRSVARTFRLSLSTVQYWVRRVGRQSLTEVDWANRSKAAHRIANKTTAELERRICVLRGQLQQTSVLGFVGAQAIQEALFEGNSQGNLPSIRTIGRILRRNGLLDRKQRVRGPAPPPGWYLPDAAQGAVELDAFDVIEDLGMENFGLIQVFTTRSLWSALAGAWPAQVASTTFILQALQVHWRAHGLPGYAQFDNDVRFQGGHNHPDVVGRVMRLCLALGVTPVFAPPLEMGFQAAIENFNGLWQQKVWSRFYHENVPALAAASQRFIQAYEHRLARHQEQVPQRKPFPKEWTPNFQDPPRGQIIYLRRTNAAGAVSILGHAYVVDPLWQHRLTRCEVDLDQKEIRFFRLRRKEPQQQPLIKVIAYELPLRRFDTRPRHRHPVTEIR